MSAEDDSHLAWPNPDCPASGRRGSGKLRWHGWSGRGQRMRTLREKIQEAPPRHR